MKIHEVKPCKLSIFWSETWEQNRNNGNNLIKIQNMGVYWPGEGVLELNTPLLRNLYTSQKENLMATRWGRLCGTMIKLGLDICILYCAF